MVRPSGQGPQRRAQSNPIGLLLVFALVITATTLIVALGAGSVTESQGQLDAEQTENALTQLDSQAALVALGNSQSQEVSLGATGAGQYDIEEDAGWMNISYRNGGTTSTVFNTTMGAIVYSGDSGTQVAYQGGGVWRRTRNNNGSVMVSPPEFHYRDATLTLPMVTISGEGSISGTANIRQNGSRRYYPNRTLNPDYYNPVDGTNLTVTVRSQYYQAWGAYFVERTEGNVTYDHDRRTVEVELQPPFDETFDSPIATTADGGVTVNGPAIGSQFEEGVNYPSADGRIESEIDRCTTSPFPCTTGGLSSITSSGTYYVSGDYTGDVSVDNPGENVSIVVDGEFDPDTVTVENVDPDHKVTVYVRNDYTMGASGSPDRLNGIDGDPTEFRVLVHSDGEIDSNGGSGMVGLLYAPGSNCDLNGGGSVSPNIIGAIVCNTVTVNGDPNEFQYDSSIQDAYLDIDDPELTRLQFLHVSLNDVNVTSG